MKPAIRTRPVHGSLQSILLSAARRSDLPVLRVAGQEYALGMAPTTSGKLVVAALPLPQGLSQTTARIRSGAAGLLGTVPRPQQHSHHLLHAAVAHHGIHLFLQPMAGHVPFQADHAPG